MGYFLLEGGAEFQGAMIEAGARALELAGGQKASVDIIPAAATPDNNHQHARIKAVQWFGRLGSENVICRMLIDHSSANDPDIAQELKRSRLIFMLGGFPSHLAQSLIATRTRSFQSIRSVLENGGIIGGSSAGAMVLCEYYYDSFKQRIKPGLNLLPGMCIIPHHNTSGSTWIPPLKLLLPGKILLGIDEQTGLINDASSGGWTVYGRGEAVLYGQRRTQSFSAGKVISHQNLPTP